MIVSCDRPWLLADLGCPHRVLSWAPHNGGLTEARHILWREVRNADLPEGLEVTPWLQAELAQRQASAAVGLMTSRDVRAHYHLAVEVEGVRVEALVTAGLSNAEAVGRRRDWNSVAFASKGWGTINIAVQIHAALTTEAQIEAMSIATQARTAAVMALDLVLPEGRVTGTGTDCIALASRLATAAPPAGALPYAGLHTAVGEAVGAAVKGATLRAAREWRDDWLARGRILPGAASG